jgi:hypothetical protein
LSRTPPPELKNGHLINWRLEQIEKRQDEMDESLRGAVKLLIVTLLTTVGTLVLLAFKHA